MHRKEFIKQCGLACLGTIGIASILEGCAAPKTVADSGSGSHTQVTPEKVTIPLIEFKQVKNGNTTYRRYVVVRSEKLKFPIVVYRNTATDYTALSLRCTHRSAEMNVSGEVISCPAHGSEFNAKGEVTHGPASTPMDRYATTQDANNLYIQIV